jgi:hypothetical protein
MAEHVPGIIGQHAVNFGKGFSAVRKQELEHVFASWQRCPLGFNARGLSRVGSHCLFHGALFCRADERGGEFPTSGEWNSSDVTPSAITGAVTSMMQSMCVLQTSKFSSMAAAAISCIFESPA